MTRSVAEIIGWELVDRFGQMTVRTPDGEHWNTSKTPTADDLLAWLREQGVALQPQRDGDLYDLCALPVTLYVITREEWTSVKAPTLLATLEAAVRAVAGES